MIYWRRYGADYLVKTISFSMLMDGAYGRLLDHYYTTEHPLPLDLDEIMNIARARTTEEKTAVERVLARKFEKRPDGYHNDRCDAEIGLSQQARDNGGKHVGKSGKTTQSGTETTTDTETGEITETLTRKRSGRNIGKPTKRKSQMPTETRHESTVNPQPSTVSTQPSTTNPQPPAVSPEPQDQHPLAPATPNAPQPDTEPTTSGVEAWGAYANAYLDRYSTYPVRNAKTNAHMLQLVKRVGAPKAPHVAAWYVAHNRAQYVAAKHPTDLLVRDCEGLHTEIEMGQSVTETQARQADRTSATANAFAPLIAEAHAALGKAS